MQARIKVAVVDDSALIRSLMARIINSQPDMICVGAAADPYAARELIRALNPDVLTLDVEMPRMGGVEFLEHLMRLRPMPVLMVSALTVKGSELANRALKCGAVDFVAKPRLDIASGMLEYAVEIADKIRAASRARVRCRSLQGSIPGLSAVAALPAVDDYGDSAEHLILVGASTGGTEAVREILEHMPVDCPGILIAQHMPQTFTRSFAARLDSLCRIRVREAVHGEPVLPGNAYIAPGSSHLLIGRYAAGYRVELSQGPPINRHRPSVDVLFRSAANCAGKNALGVILTGMGRDGAIGLSEMHNAGAWTVAQDEASCVVYGMPREAIAAGAVDEILPLQEIAGRIMMRLGSMGRRGLCA